MPIIGLGLFQNYPCFDRNDLNSADLKPTSSFLGSKYGQKCREITVNTKTYSDELDLPEFHQKVNFEISEIDLVKGNTFYQSEGGDILIDQVYKDVLQPNELNKLKDLKF